MHDCHDFKETYEWTGDSASSKYICSLYWAMTTVTTVPWISWRWFLFNFGPFFTTMWENMFGNFFQASNIKQIQVVLDEQTLEI